MVAAVEDLQRPVIAVQNRTVGPEKEIESNTAKAVKTTPAWDLKSRMGALQRESREWNTKNLSARLMVDAACGITAGVTVAPVVSMIDKAIMENASGKRPLMESIKASATHFLTRPHLYITGKPFALILMVYGGTYLSANLLDTFKSTTKSQPATKTTHGTAKFVATSGANLGLTMIKDSQFTKMFGTVSARPVPPVTYALFAIRDAMTVFASFNVPPLIAPRLPLGEAAERYISRASVAQFIAPAAIQLISTPIHLYGLDLYNRNGGTTFSDRLQKVRVDWLKSSLARMCRIVPAFGFGGVVNNSLRLKLQKQLE